MSQGKNSKKSLKNQLIFRFTHYIKYTIYFQNYELRLFCFQAMCSYNWYGFFIASLIIKFFLERCNLEVGSKYLCWEFMHNISQLWCGVDKGYNFKKYSSSECLKYTYIYLILKIIKFYLGICLFMSYNCMSLSHGIVFHY